jgi:hypothetical protein
LLFIITSIAKLNNCSSPISRDLQGILIPEVDNPFTAAFDVPVYGNEWLEAKYKSHGKYLGKRAL